MEKLAIWVSKKEGETNESLMRRFTKKVQSSGMIPRVKKIKFKEPVKNRQLQKKDALRKRDIKQQYDYLRKSGKLDELNDPTSAKRFIRVKKKK